MLFSKRGLPLIDQKMPAASLPIAATHFHATTFIPFSLFEESAVTVPADTVVRRGDTLYADGEGLVTPAFVSGTVLGEETVSHPLYGNVRCVSVRPEDGEETALSLPFDPQDATADNIIEAAKLAGIVDEIDGVPLFEKLRYCAHGCQVVADGVEAQPYASAAYRVLCEQPDAVTSGLSLVAKVVEAKGRNIAVCLENAQMRKTIADIYKKEKVYFAPRRYPVDKYTDHEREVCRVGVQALCALHQAVYERKAATTTVITVAGDMVKQPQNLRVPFGTPIQSLLDFCGVNGTPAVMVGGDILTGIALTDTSCPVLHGMTCLLLLSAVPAVQEDPCIGCGRCAQVCHKELLPYEIVRRLENMHYERLINLRAVACDGCGACSFVCPAGRDVKNAVLYAAEQDGSVVLEWGGNDDA